MDLGEVHETEAAVRRVKWAEYVEPELFALRRSGMAVLGARVALVLWAIALVVVAALLRLDVVDETVSTTWVSRLGLVGLLVATVGAAVGWNWTDRATRNIHHLEARLPSRFRCVSGWAWPLVWVVVLSITILRLEPAELVDVRPVIVTAIFAAALWRPYSLVRRILKSLIRIDSDLAIGSAYLLDLTLFGLLWARLGNLPSELGPTNVGVAGSLLGLAALAAIAAVGNVGVWYLLVRDVNRAVDHRHVAMRTRHEHRQLRLVGIDPLDPKVRLALHMIHQDALRAELEHADTGDVGGDQGGPIHPDDAGRGVIADDGVGGVLEDGEPSEPVDERDPSGDPIAVSIAPLTEDREPGDAGSISDELVAVEDGSPAVAALAFEDQVAVEVVSASEDQVPVEPGSPDDEVPPEDVSSSEDQVPIEDVDRRAVRRDPLDRIAARVRLDHEGTRPEPATPDDAAPRASVSPSGDADGADDRKSDHRAAAASLSDRLAARIDRIESEPPSDRIDRLTRRLGGESAAGDERSILDRLERLGIAAAGASIPEDGTGRHTDDPGMDTDLMIERLYSLELARYLLVLATVVCAGASVWFVTRSVDVGNLIDGSIVPSDLDRVEVARVASVRTLAVVLALVPLWCAVAARWANRVDIEVPGAARCVALTVVSGVFVGAGFVADPASNVMLFAMFGALGAALWSVPVMIEIERRFGRSTTIPSLLSLALGSSVLVAWIGRLLRPVAATDSVEAMSFSGGLLALVVAMAAVVTTVSSGDIVEAIKLSPAAPKQARRSSTDAR